MFTALPAALMALLLQTTIWSRTIEYAMASMIGIFIGMSIANIGLVSSSRITITPTKITGLIVANIFPRRASIETSEFDLSSSRLKGVFQQRYLAFNDGSKLIINPIIFSDSQIKSVIQRLKDAQHAPPVQASPH
jgi:hypothetical protein